MQIDVAQRDVRFTFLGGFAGQLVSGTLWILAAAISTWVSPRYGMYFLVVGGFFIFPLTQLALKLMGQKGSLEKGHPMNQLGTQAAFTLPLNIPLIIAATLYREEWFFPAFMIATGAHYLPFVHLYGMWQFGILAGVLWMAGFVIGYVVPGLPFSTGGWVGGVILLGYAFLIRNTVVQERERIGNPALS